MKYIPTLLKRITGSFGKTKPIEFNILGTPCLRAIKSCHDLQLSE
ncbi:hypothetical protein GARC_0410 [Paraglaciecola arctica BSs20135]|uniref:Uncharacterized protein n=1 Tax=Paraglaciecola arctica BSs20135 TaxID=493475 RepID=K6YGW1_9ALTE|nr:hypothetical protein GARC_0410 [Paraglaciecola arctica BSs20135]